MAGMKAVVLSGINQLAVTEVPAPSPAAGEVVVSLRAAALNHRDVWIKLGQYAGVKFPCRPGSDGAGVVQAVGRDVDVAWIGREVVINPSFDWGISPQAQGPRFTILGLPREGTLAEQINVPLAQITAKPAHLSWNEAAALPLAGLTAYRAVFSRAGLKPGERVLINGIGGGVALFALQFAIAADAEVYVTSSSAEKRERARSLGAKGGFDYTQSDWAAQAAKQGGPFDVIVDSAGGEGFDALIDAAAAGGRIVFYGATRGNPNSLALRKVFWRQISLLGTTMGSPDDWADLMAFVGRHKIKPVISDVFKFQDTEAAFALMERGGQFGKIVVQLA
jgi:NADPH:quinone reductase-like Zn-dependent oxidoreductase